MMTFYVQELGHQVAVIRKVADKVFSETGVTVKYKIGTMIEIPRAALVADQVEKLSILMHHCSCFTLLILLVGRVPSINLGNYLTVSYQFT
jgi:hypothetical protein